MSVREIIGPSDPRLFGRCREVESIDDEVRQLVVDLHETLGATTGVGLAAPQLGVDLRVCIVDPHRDGQELNASTLINPVLVRKWGDPMPRDEGCKSVPGVRVMTPRYAGVEVKALDLEGAEVQIAAEGFEAIVLQHELDHLDGRLLTGRAATVGVAEDFAFSRWQEANLAQIALRLKRAADAPYGLLENQSRTGYELLTVRDGSQIQLFFASGGAEPDMSGIMSRIDVSQPLHLLGLYTQAMILAMAWVPDAERIYHIGFGGGRIPMVLHHYFPNLATESTELDREVVRIARRWFGIEQDERMQVFVEDGREYLERQPKGVEYDAILVDCFTGSGQHPYALSTEEFYRLTREHLSPGGVVATNLVSSDPLFEEKWSTMASTFAHVWRYETDAANVFFGSDEDIPLDELKARGRSIYARAPFSFPFIELFEDLVEVAAPASVRTLSDQDRDLDADDPVFIGVPRNAPCPCGSGKKFKNCHGR